MLKLFLQAKQAFIEPSVEECQNLVKSIGTVYTIRIVLYRLFGHHSFQLRYKNEDAVLPGLQSHSAQEWEFRNSCSTQSTEENVGALRVCPFTQRRKATQSTKARNEERHHLPSTTAPPPQATKTFTEPRHRSLRLLSALQ